MWALIGAIWLMLNYAEVLAHIRIEAPEVHVPTEQSPTFVRSAVESLPSNLDSMSELSRLSMRSTFGEVFLPLRSAVESVPTVSIENVNALKDSTQQRAFVRDSVEAMPVNDDISSADDVSAYLTDGMKTTHEKFEEHNLNLKFKNHEQRGPFTNFGSLAESVKDNMDLPRPFRADSPYQQLVKAIDVEQLELIEDIERVKEQLSFGSLSDAASAEERRPYGALAAAKVSKNYNNSPKVLCYITNWAFYRKADGKFVPENLDSTLCTAVIYSFASLDPDHLTIKEFDPFVDIENQFYSRIVKSGIPVMVSMGGWTDSAGNKYSRLAGDEIKRRVFASNLVGYLLRNGFSGLHLDWNYPKCWQSDCSKGPASDRPNLTKLLREIRMEFNRAEKKLQLGVAISGYKEIINEAYELRELSEIVDYLTVMSYDYHGAWERQTGHVSPLYGKTTDRYPQYNTDYTMQLLVKLGAKKEKLIMGIPFYGQSFSLQQESATLVGEGNPSTGPGEPGEFTKQPGMLAYYEICQRIRKYKWLTGRDVERKSGPYAMLRNQWVGYEDPASVEAKARYAVNNGFGGVAAWTVDLDDFQNRCCGESYPLLKAINRAMGRLSSPPPSNVNCDRPPQPVTPEPPVVTTVSSDGSSGMNSHEHTTSKPGWSPASSTTGWPSWTPSTSTTSQRPVTTTTTQKTSTEWWYTTSTSTTRRPLTTQRPTSTASYPGQTTIPSPAVVRPVIQSSDCQAGQFYADRNNCNAYYQCITAGELRQQFCPGGLHWNDHTKNCDWPSSAQCSVKNKPMAPTTSRPTWPTWSYDTTTVRTQRPPKRTTPSTTTRRPIFSTTTTLQTPINDRTTRKPQRPSFERPTSKCNNGEYYTHKNCGHYYICVNGALVPNSCGSNLHWDAIREICDWPENVQCVSTKQYLRIVKAKANTSDPCNGEQRIPYPGDCSKYLFCLWNRLQGADCPPGLHFSSARGLCDWPSKANCYVSGGDDIEEPLLIQSDNNIANFKPPRPVQPKPAPTTKRPPITTTTTYRPTYQTDKPVLEPFDGYYKVVCYFTNWAWYRKGLGRYTPDDINTDLCTHVVYGFAVLDYSNLIIRTHDSWADIDNNFYTRVSGLRSKGVKVSLALGGWNDSQGDKYSRLVRNPESRARFIRHAIEFIEKYGFEGLDLDWEYPVCWQTECNKGMADEKQAFTALVRELSVAFKPRGLLLSSAVSPSKKIIDAGYEVAQLSRYFDWIAVMTYDFHGQWDKKTGHVAPLYIHPNDDIDYFNANYSIHYWIEKGAPSRKIVMGMPLYGQSFTLENARNNGLNAKAPGPGQAGEFTKAAGFLAYYEICDRIQNQGWEVVQDERGRMGPFARKGTQWVSFDDPAMIRKKSQFVRALDLGGAMVWALDLDDFKNRCGYGVHPLLREIHHSLKDPPRQYEPTPALIPEEPESSVEEQNVLEEVIMNPQMDLESNNENIQELPIGENAVDPNKDIEKIDVEIQNSSEGESSSNNVPSTGSDSTDDFKVVCYFTNWAWYRQGGGKFMPEDIDPDLCTHIIYGFAVLNRETLTIQPHDSWADIDNNFYNRVVEYRSKGIKVTVAIGGWNDSAGDKYARLVRNPAARARFIKNVIEFIEKYNFDGLDLDWEYPVCWQVDCKKGTADEKQSFTALVRELAQAFKPSGLLLSSAVSPNKKVIDAGYDVAKLSQYFDWIAVMTYDYHGQWDKKTGHVAPMYDHPDGTPTFNANFSINYWLESGADRKKIVMGMPMYGQSFSLAQASEHDLNAPTYGGGEAGEATRARGFLAYYEICAYVQKRGWNVVRDPRGRMGPYAYLRDQWVSFDDTHMIRHKSEYVRAMGLAGAMIWALDLDDFRNVCNCESYPLLKTINRVLRNYPGPHPKCVLEQKEKTMIATAGGASQAYIASLQQHVDPPFEQDLTIDEVPIQKTDCDGRDFAPHELDCNKYYVCQHGGLLERRCPEGLHWNEVYCDWPQNVNCNVELDSKFQNAAIKRPGFPIITYANNDSSIGRNTSVETLYSRPIQKPNQEHNHKVICYFTNHAWYRPGLGKYIPEDIDENHCTHIVYAFAVLDSSSLTIRTYDFYADIDNKFYQRVLAYKHKGCKVTLAIGGWNDSEGRKYARLVLDPESRARFIESVLSFIGTYGFDGLDLNWEFPACPHVNCSKGMPGEKEGYAALVQELSDVFKGRGLLLSASVSPSKIVIDSAYDIPVLAKYLDWIGVMTYDYHGNFDKQTGHIAPLFYRDDDTNEFFNANFSINYWLEKGAPRHKLIMGMPLYGQTFTLANPEMHGLNQISIGPGRAGTHTRAAGFLSYYEICDSINSGGWTVTRDPKGHIGPYAYNGNQWVSYDDVEDIRRKSHYIKHMGLGGGMVWALDLDDFRGRCGCGKYPLLRTLSQELRSIPSQHAYDCT